MSSELNIPYDELNDMTPENIAEILFSEMPNNLPPTQLLINIPENDDNDSTYTHEILLTILMEGIMKFNNNLHDTQLNDVQLIHIEALNPWFNNIKINLRVSELNNEDDEKYKYYYSKIILKKMPEYEMLFKIKQIDKHYTFFLNPLYIREPYPFVNLNEVYSVIFLNNKIFKIQFELKKN